MIAQHSSESVEHYTPAPIVEAARATLGGIDLDPATCEVANEVVMAKYCMGDCSTFAIDGLGVEWHGRVFLNPPGGKLDRETLEPLPRNTRGVQGGPGVSSAAVWWAKLIAEWEAGRVHSAIFICFSMAILRTAQEVGGCAAPFEFPFCVPRDRVNYDRAVWQEIADPNDAARIVAGRWIREATKGAPADSAIVLVPPKKDVADSHFGCETIRRFHTAFSPFGVVRI